MRLDAYIGNRVKEIYIEVASCLEKQLELNSTEAGVEEVQLYRKENEQGWMLTA